jgi:hypothetical protein
MEQRITIDVTGRRINFERIKLELGRANSELKNQKLASPTDFRALIL